MSFDIVKFIDSPVSIRPRPRGAYNASTAYVIADSVSYNGSSYVAIQDTTGNAPTDTTYWQLMAAKGEGLAASGTTSQALTKVDGTDYNTQWSTINKSFVGLSNVDNTSDANKPVSTATQTALDTKESTANKGVANGYASLDSGGKVPVAQLPSSIMEYQGTWNATTNSPSLADGTGNTGDVYRVSTAGSQNLGSGSITFDIGDYVIYNGTIWEKSDTTDAVASVAGKTGNVTLTKSDVGLGNVDNTSDATKNSAAATLTNKTLDNTSTITVKDANFTIQDDVDTTKQMKFDITGISTGTTRTYNVPNASTTLVGHNTSHTLTNKSIDLSTNTLTGTTAQFNTALSDGDFATLAGTETLTNKTISGSSNTLSNIAQSSVTSLTTDLANRAQIVVYNSANELKSVSLNANPESAWFTFETNYISDIFFNLLRGGLIDVQKNGSPYNTYGSTTGFYNVNGGTVADEWFRPDSGFCMDSPSVVSTDTYVITVDLPASVLQRYGCYVGIVFPHGWGTKDIQIETYKGGVWTSLYNVTNSSDPIHRVYYGNDATTYTKVRYTLGRPWQTQLRISSLFSYSFNSTGRSAGYLARGGGAVYGSNTTPVAFTATGGDTNISINMVPKGTGTLNQNGVPVVTTTGSQTLTNKSLTNPVINNDGSANGAVAFKAGGAARVYFNAYSSGNPDFGVEGPDANINIDFIPKGTGAMRITGMSGQTVSTLYGWGTATNVDLDLRSKGTGVVKLNGVEAVSLTGTQTLTNKTLTSPKITSGNAPATATSTGTTGQIAWDANYVYICTATNTWKRAAIATW